MAVHVRKMVHEVVFDVAQNLVDQAADHRHVPTKLHLKLAQAVRVCEALQGQAQGLRELHSDTLSAYHIIWNLEPHE